MTAVNANLVLMKSWEISPDSLHFKAAQESGGGKIRALLWISKEADETLFYPFAVLDYALYRLYSLTRSQSSVVCADMLYGPTERAVKEIENIRGPKGELSVFRSRRGFAGAGAAAEETAQANLSAAVSAVKKIAVFESGASKPGLEIEEWCPAYLPYWKDAKAAAQIYKKAKPSRGPAPKDEVFRIDGSRSYAELRDDLITHFAARAALLP